MKISHAKISFIAFFISTSFSLLAQNSKTFIVLDKQNDQPISGVNIQSVNNTYRSVTNSSGFFNYSIVEYDTISFSHVGYLKHRVPSSAMVDTIYLQASYMVLETLEINPLAYQSYERNIEKVLNKIGKNMSKNIPFFSADADITIHRKENGKFTFKTDSRVQFLDELSYHRKTDPYRVAEKIKVHEKRSSLNFSTNTIDIKRSYYDVYSSPYKFLLYNGLHYKTFRKPTYYFIGDTLQNRDYYEFDIHLFDEYSSNKMKDGFNDWFDIKYKIIVYKDLGMPLITEYQLNYTSVNRNQYHTHTQTINFQSTFQRTGKIMLPQKYQFALNQFEHKSDGKSTTNEMVAVIDFFNRKTNLKKPTLPIIEQPQYNDAFWSFFPIKKSVHQDLSDFIPLEKQWSMKENEKIKTQDSLSFINVIQETEKYKKPVLFVLWDNYRDLLPLNGSLSWLPSNELTVFIIYTSNDLFNYYEVLIGNDYMYYYHSHIPDFTTLFSTYFNIENFEGKYILFNPNENNVIYKSDIPITKETLINWLKR